MSTKMVDSVMKKVEQAYKLDFYINANSDLSKEISALIQKKSNGKYNGYNGEYSVENKMLYTDNCRRDGSKLVVPPQGVVYGPYQTFPKGVYYAVYEFGGAGKCNAEINICSSDTNLIEGRKVCSFGTTIINFELAQETKNVEFKLINHGTSDLIFQKVVVLDHAPDGQLASGRETVERYTEKQQLGIDYDNKTDEQFIQLDYQSKALSENVSSLSKYIASGISNAEKYEKCELPDNTSKGFIKRLIRRVIKCYTRFQIDFNSAIMQIARQLHQKTNLLAEGHETLRHMIENTKATTDELYFEQKRFEDKIEELTREIQENKRKNEERENLYQDISNLWAKITEFDTHFGEVWNKQEQISFELQNRASGIQEEIKEKAQDITNLWNKIVEHDTSFKDIWDKQRSINAEISSIWEKNKNVDRDFQSEWEHDKRCNDELAQLWKNYQMLRQEVFYEIDYRIRRMTNSDSEFGSPTERGTKDREILEPVVKSSEKAIIEANKGEIHLNLGCGHIPVEGYINVDARDLPGVDVVADIQRLPYGKETVDEIFSAHLLEHFEISIMEREIMPYWISLLRKGGKLRIIFPDAECMIDDYNKGNKSFEELARIIMGAQDYDKDYHYTMYNTQRVIDMLKGLGLNNITVIERGRINGDCRETEIVATK